MSPLPAWFHELVVAPSAFALALLHARRALGARRGAGELLVTVNDQLWERHLPMLIRARHNHRLGGCRGS